MAVWSELWNSILQARLDQMGWNLKWFIFELFLTEIVNDFLIKTANFKMWFYAVSKMLHLTLTLCLSLASQQMAFFPICILPCTVGSLCSGIPHSFKCLCHHPKWSKIIFLTKYYFEIFIRFLWSTLTRLLRWEKMAKNDQIVREKKFV